MTIPTDGRIDLDALAELARKATPGPWRVASDLPAYAIMAMTPEGKGGHRVVQTPNQNNYRRFGPSNGWDGISQIANAAFIAALDPQTVLALIDMARRAAIPSEQEPGAWSWFDPNMGETLYTGTKKYADEAAALGSKVTAYYAHPAPAAGVRVKALEWSEEDDRFGVSYSVVGIYRYGLGDDGVTWSHSGKHMGHCDSRAAAKAAAQADYEQRIRAALEPAPPAPPSREEGLREAAWRDVIAERERQKSVEGWTPEHDDEHADGQLARAAVCYANPRPQSTKDVPHHWSDESRYMDAQSEPIGEVRVPVDWPWDGQWWKPADRRRDLVRAGALILAEIERLDRALSHANGGE